MTPLLEVRGLSCSFGATRALDGVDLTIGTGELVALLGQNGAGKSTLIKVLAGVHRPSAGSVRVGGRIAFVHQDLGLVGPLSVSENIAHVAGFEARRGFVSWRRQRTLARRALERWELDIDPAVPVQALDPVQRALVAISRALAADAQILVLDEPTAALPRGDVEILFSALDRMRAAGVACLYVTHRLSEVARLADRVVVLRDGVRVADSAARGLTPEDIVELIVGGSLDDARSRLPAPSAEPVPVLELERAASVRTSGISLSLARGEILALVGLVGAGQRSAGRLVAGAEPLREGSMRLGGLPYRPRSPRQAVARRVAYIPGDRQHEGTFPAFDCTANLCARPRPGTLWHRPGRESRRAAQVLRAWDVTPCDPGAAVRSLSGGNQQRLVMAKWLHEPPAVLVAEEPTAGVDVAGRAAIHERIIDAARDGVATLLVSSDAEEVAELAHRALVFDGGRPITELRREDLTVDRITLECGRA
jgi:ribose transport system ATP-binding protein